MRQLWREKLETTIHQAGLFDLRDWLRVQDRVKGLERADQAARDQFTGRPVQDTFFSLFKSDPRIAQDIKPGLRPLGDLLEKAMETPNFQQLHDACRGDRVAAGMAASEFFNEFVKQIPEDVKEKAQEARKAQHTTDESIAQAQAAAAAAEAYRDQAQDLAQQAQDAQAQAQVEARNGNEETAELEQIRADGLHEQAQDAQAEADKLEALTQALEELAQGTQEAAQQHADAAGEAIEAQGAQIAQAAQQAAQQADEKTQEALAFVKGFSQAAGGDPQNIDPEALEYGMELFRQFPQVADFAKILGWTKRVAQAEYRNSPRGRSEFKGYKLQELDLAHMAAHEWVAFAGGRRVGRRDWIRRVADGEISHNDYEGEEKEGRGPIVWVTDQSGSMSGQPAMMVKALEWALIDIARADGREFHSIAFAGHLNWEHWKAPDKPDYAGLFDHMRRFLGGGTEPYEPLKAGLALIEAGDLQADLVLSTDGVFDDPPAEFLQDLEAVKARRPLRLETVLVDTPGASDHKAHQFSDRVTNLSSFITDKNKVRDIIKAVV